ncbi:MAG TPA: DMT family transporter [Ilumatobacter sp.]|nr:DMT family transporter [Ilumatobacter sp.]
MRAPSNLRSDHNLGVIAVLVAITAWGMTSVIIKSIDMNAISIAFWRFLVYAAMLTAWMRVRGGRFSFRLLWTAAPGGLLLSGDVFLFFTAIKVTNVVNATTIGALQPLVIAVFATRLFGEHISRREIAAALVAIAGVVVVITQSAGTPEWSGAGDLAAVGALFCWSGYFVVAKRMSDTLTPIQFTTGTAWWVGITALPVGLLFAQDMSPPPTSEWPALILLLLVGGVLGHSLMNWGIPRVPLWLSSTLTLMIPVLASLAAWVFLDEPLTVVQLVAMGVVVAALAVIVTAQSTPARLQPVDVVS